MQLTTTSSVLVKTIADENENAESLFKQNSRRRNSNTIFTVTSVQYNLLGYCCTKYKRIILFDLKMCLQWILLVGCLLNQSVAASVMQPNNNIDRRIWPPMKHHDIWSAVATDASESAANGRDNLEFVAHKFESNNTLEQESARVIHLFPVPVDGECLSDDGRRTGTCYNAYECRLKGGMARGECAMGFGVCCIFIHNCSTNTIVSHNITYLVSPNFPSFMPNNLSSCSLRVKPLSNDISQLRIDFLHFALGQPNRRNGVCDGDAFTISGGSGGVITLCGQNNGQHIYYDVGGRVLPRQTLFGSLRPLTYEQLYPNRYARGNDTEQPLIEINLNFTQRFLPQRMWEIRITQIPFSQRAPPGCLQYYTEKENVIQTFNFADNGRHLANQNYRICMRQETGMCSIVYQPCDEQSFRIGPIEPLQMSGNSGGVGTPMTVMGGILSPMNGMLSMGNLMGGMVTNAPSNMLNMQNQAITATTQMLSSASTNAAATTNATTTAGGTTQGNTVGNLLSNSTANATPTQRTTASTPDTPDTPDTPNTPATTAAMGSSSSSSSSSTPMMAASSTTTAPLNDDYDEGSGGSSDYLGITPTNPGVSRRPRPVSGGFDLLGLLRSAFDFNYRHGRQFYSSCRDRITMPCIVEDFIGTGLGPLPGCEPVHCGAQFCASGTTPCRIESTVTPFYIGVHFGEGNDKGSAEDNIGACLRYTQVQCT